MTELNFFVAADGAVQTIYAEAGIPVAEAIGDYRIDRVSYVEPDQYGRWWADLAPVGGPRLGPFPPDARQAALNAETAWLRDRLRTTTVRVRPTRWARWRQFVARSLNSTMRWLTGGY